MIAAVVERGDRLAWLEPPGHHGAFTIAEVASAVDAEGHALTVGRWPTEASLAWRPHHRAVAALADASLARL